MPRVAKKINSPLLEKTVKIILDAAVDRVRKGVCYVGLMTWQERVKLAEPLELDATQAMAVDMTKHILSEMSLVLFERTIWKNEAYILVCRQMDVFEKQAKLWVRESWLPDYQRHVGEDVEAGMKPQPPDTGVFAKVITNELVTLQVKTSNKKSK